MSLASSKIAANIPVNDMPRAVKFYGETLGLKIMQPKDWVAVAIADDGSILALAQRVAPMQTENDIANFTVADIKATISELKSKGVEFMDYSLPYLKTVDHIAERDGFMAAWFKDSEGNLLQVNQSPKM